jgi:hypothetical protein
MTIYVCRVDGETFWNEAECHYHVDLHHPEWGHAVCVRGTPAPFQCITCNKVFESKLSCEQHIKAEHGKSGDLSNEWKIILSDS